MRETRKINRYRKTLHELTRPQHEERRKKLEGDATKLGNEIRGEERKGKPRTKSSMERL